jgi:hypothetical protein
MKPQLVETTEQLRSLWLDPRRGSRSWFTNFYPDEDKVRTWISRGSLYGLSFDDSSVILRRDRDFFHVYLSCKSSQDIHAVVESLGNDRTFVVDLVFREEPDRIAIDSLTESQFIEHATLKRLRRPPKSTDEPLDGRDVRTASEDDGPWILESLESNFDRFAEQLPDASEISRATSHQQILIVGGSTLPKGFLYHEIKQNLSVVRYWYVDPRYREEGVGAQLIRYHLGSLSHGKPCELWVLNDNDNALKRYLHYGFEPEGLKDRVYIRRGR